MHESKINSMCAANRASLEVGGRFTGIAACTVML